MVLMEKKSKQVKHIKMVIYSKIMYCSETIFKTSHTAKVEQNLKLERKIVRTCMNKKCFTDGHWRIDLKEEKYKENENTERQTH